MYETKFCFLLVANRDEDGAVIIQPKNITTMPIKKGNIDKVLLGGSNMSYNACGEPYENPAKTSIARRTDMAAITSVHEKNWVYAKIIKKNYLPPYEHKTDRRDVVKNYRDEEGAVIIAPRNFLTNPIKKGRVGKQTTFSGPIPF